MNLVMHLKDLLRLITKELGLDDEKRVFLGMVVFKERLALFMLSRTLETLRDVILRMPINGKEVVTEENARVK